MTMREILFRGKRVKPVALVSQWILGNYVFKADGSLPGLGKHFIVVHDGFGLSQWVEVDPDTIGEYTDLTDKNGKKIFEGDILSIARRMDGMGTYYFPAIEYPVNVVVKWDMCGWMWETIAEDTRYISFPDAWCHYECEVIGNIHDTPELMEGEHHG